MAFAPTPEQLHIHELFTTGKCSLKTGWMATTIRANDLMEDPNFRTYLTALREMNRSLGGIADQVRAWVDDGPIPATTPKILEILAAECVKATFFINTNNAIDVNSSSAARNTLSRIIAEGHELVNHTVHHYDFSSTSTNVETELAAQRSGTSCVR